ncbi:hypothetical protein V8G54_017304 [Vigna mungo]|uniref:CSC1-like protein At1g69450 n=1 Tax=Vigna mungo TaxID=3915 RepID=A0AAQ3RYL7_VIGMU
MIVSALLTSVGINTALCVLFFTLYSILRKQPSNYEVYVPRLLAEGISKRRSRFNLERLIPSAGWVAKAWRLSEEELLSLSGLDGVVFMRMITFSLKMFTFAGMIGMLVILPVNCWGNQLKDIDVVDFVNNSLDVFTISNVNSGSHWLWVHFIAVYIVSGFICMLLFFEYKYISSKRISYFYSSEPQPHHFTILVHSIPTSSSSSISDSVERFFSELYPSTYLSHVVVRRTGKIHSLVSEAKKLYKRVTQLRSDPTPQKRMNRGISGIFRQKTNVIEEYQKKLENIEESVRFKQSEASLAGEEARAAFVFFRSRLGAATAFHIKQSVNPTHWITEFAPEPRDVYWPFFSESFMRRWISKKFFSEIVTGYLPSLILQLFLKVVPPAMKFLSSIQGYISHSDIEMSASRKVLWFTVWNVFFASVFSGSILSMLQAILDPKNIPAKLAVAVPAQASFFITYVVTQGWTSVSSELFRVIPFLFCRITRLFTSLDDDEFEVPSIPYHKDIPRVLFFGLLGITYFFLAPLILPFLLAYFCLAYIIYRNQVSISYDVFFLISFMNVYAPKYDTAGKFWPVIHNSMIFSLVLMQIIAVGIFALKKLSMASTLAMPLPFLTLLFNEYCRKRFLPIFVAYSAESLIKKDRQDQNGATMTQFYEDLVNAYKDPALLPLQYLPNNDNLRTPLIPQA